MSLKKIISTILVYFIQFFKWVNEFFTGNAYNPNPNYFEDLTPVSNADEDDVYSKTLVWALDNLNIRNIALTGPYGSGKSSILKTFERKHPEYKYLNISLASFDEISADKEEDRKRIELSILQQVFYRVSGRKTPDSRFKRIKSTSGTQLFIQAFLLILWVIAGLFLFKPDFFQRISILKPIYKTNGDWILYTSATIFLFGLLLILKRTLRNYNSARFHKLNLTSGEIELVGDVDASILNKYLDEILYFFEKTRYNVIALEDLDRFDDPEKIFSKLRELNNIINNSSQITHKITFIYALKDDIFIDNDRTKFFDFFIPVIPVINSSNSAELLLKKFQDAKSQDNLSDDFLMNVTFFIEDMRQLKNVYNEYIIYKKKLKLTLNDEKLFSIILYKNFYPTDFAELNVNKGLIYDSFENKKSILKSLKDELNQQILSARTLVEELELTYIENLNELRGVYLYALQKQLSDSYRYRINGVSYILAELDDDLIFEDVMKENNISTMTISYGSWRLSGISFKTIENAVNDKQGYHERKKLINLKFGNETEKLKNKIAKLNHEISSLENSKLSDLIERRPEGAILPSVSKERILVYLLRHGYIDEMYQSYISHFYEGTITRSDMDFVFSIKNYTALPANFSLTKVEQVVKKLQQGDYSQREILNYNLIDFLAEKNVTYKAEFLAVIKQLSDKKEASLKFIDDYLKVGKLTNVVFKALCKQWPEIWDDINTSSGFTKERIDEYLKMIMINADTGDLKNLNKSGRFKIDIQNQDAFLTIFSTNEHDEIIKKLLKELNIEFKNIEFIKERKELFDFIYNNANYEINEAMIKTIIENYASNPTNEKGLKEANYSTIRISNCSSLINYIQENIEIYLYDVFFAILENVKEDEKYLLELLNNSQIDADDKISIIEKQETPVTDLLLVDPSLWLTLFDKIKVAPTWNNVTLRYLETNSIDEMLLKYLNDESIYSRLSKSFLSKVPPDQENSKALSASILTDDNLSNASYRHLIKGIPWTWDSLSMEKISSDKVDILLSVKKVNVTKSNYETLKTHFNGKNIRLLETDFPKYKSLKDSIVFDKDDYKLLYSSDILTPSQRKSLILEMDLSLINSALGALITNIIYRQKMFPLQFPLLSKLVEFNASLKAKVDLINHHFKLIDKEKITELLKNLKGDFANITVKGNKPSIPATDENRTLANLLDESNYISSVKEAKGKITFYTWKK